METATFLLLVTLCASVFSAPAILDTPAVPATTLAQGVLPDTKKPEQIPPVAGDTNGEKDTEVIRQKKSNPSEDAVCITLSDPTSRSTPLTFCSEGSRADSTKLFETISPGLAHNHINSELSLRHLQKPVLDFHKQVHLQVPSIPDHGYPAYHEPPKTHYIHSHGHGFARDEYGNAASLDNFRNTNDEQAMAAAFNQEMASRNNAQVEMEAQARAQSQMWNNQQFNDELSTRSAHVQPSYNVLPSYSYGNGHLGGLALGGGGLAFGGGGGSALGGGGLALGGGGSAFGGSGLALGGPTVGVFPNSLAGSGCGAIPLLLSCSPNLVHGQLLQAGHGNGAGYGLGGFGYASGLSLGAGGCGGGLIGQSNGLGLHGGSVPLYRQTEEQQDSMNKNNIGLRSEMTPENDSLQKIDEDEKSAENV